MAQRNHHLTVSLGNALYSVTDNPQCLLDKLASVAGPEADVGPQVARSLCDACLLDSLRLHLDTSEQEMVLKAVTFALQEKLDNIPTGPNSGSAGLDLLLQCLCITPVQGFWGLESLAKGTRCTWRLLCNYAIVKMCCTSCSGSWQMRSPSNGRMSSNPCCLV